MAISDFLFQEQFGGMEKVFRLGNWVGRSDSSRVHYKLHCLPFESCGIALEGIIGSCIDERLRMYSSIVTLNFYSSSK